MSNLQDLTDRLKYQARLIGFSKVGIAPAQSGMESQRLREWLDQGHHGDMAWMANPHRQDVQSLMVGVKSIVSVALNYYTPHAQSNDPDRGKISRYGWGKDYHKVMGKMLKQLCRWLEQQGDQVQTRFCVDTAPISDKAWAQRSGIGWIGKHSNVITKEYGSWVFLGEILTNLELIYDSPHPDRCGKCRLCIDACPTQAIVSPYVVSAPKCIAYHTIESRQPDIPPEISSKMQNWVAGCDICQEVCPYNRRPVHTTIADFHPYPHNLHPRLTDLAQMTETQWDQQFRSSALRRIKPQFWRRNAQAVISAHSPT
jgi:epoxyqueuosine reductase